MKDERLTKMMRNNRDAARRSLVELVRTLLPYGKTATIVFDGHGEDIRGKDRVNVYFSLTRSADSMIGVLVGRRRDAEKTAVVSSDHEVMNQAAALGAIPIRSEDFLSRADSGKSPGRIEKPDPKDLGQDEIDEWLDIFQGGKSEE